MIYPSGDGIGQDTSDVSRAIAVLRSQALVVLRFDVNEAGRPVRFRVQKASEIGWGNDAISIVSRWRFLPAKEDGVPVSVPCAVELVWSGSKLTSEALVRARELLGSDEIVH